MPLDPQLRTMRANDQAEQYADRLRDPGIAVELKRYATAGLTAAYAGTGARLS